MSRGGARPGAGRKGDAEPRCRVTVKVSAQTRRIMDEMKTRGMNISREVDEMFLTFARNFGLIKDDERGARP